VSIVLQEASALKRARRRSHEVCAAGSGGRRPPHHDAIVQEAKGDEGQARGHANGEQLAPAGRLLHAALPAQLALEAHGVLDLLPAARGSHSGSQRLHHGISPTTNSQPSSL
jgi:hypothetical protein